MNERHPYDAIQRKPIVCIWEITRACNLRCIHCENFGGEPGEAELTFDEMLRVVDGLATLGCRCVDITGGEPLLHPRWDALALALRDRNIRTSLVTNGLLLDDAHLDRAEAAGVEIIAISLDGPGPVHDRIRRRPGRDRFMGSPFDATIDALQRSVKRFSTKVITQVNVLNIEKLGGMRQMLGNLGVSAWQIQLAIPVGRLLTYRKPFVLSPTQLNDLTAFIEAAQMDGKYPRIDTADNIGYYTRREIALRQRTTGQGVWLGCQAGIRSVAITYDGTVRGCSILPPEFDAGDLHSERIEEIWKDANRFAYSTAFDTTKLSGDCATCRMGALCRAGCTSMAYYSTGTVYANPYCISRPAIVEEQQIAGKAKPEMRLR